jgi:hypothetical protein
MRKRFPRTEPTTPAEFGYTMMKPKPCSLDYFVLFDGLPLSRGRSREEFVP